MTAREPLPAHDDAIRRLLPEARAWRPIGDGWTSATYLVDDRWIVQLPRSDYAAERLRFQVSFLPELAHEVSALVPVPERVGDDPPALVYDRLDGVAADEAPDGIWPERLGRFLYDLHAVPPEFVGLRATTPGALRGAERTAWEELRARVAPVADGDLGVLDAVTARLLDDDDLWAFAPVLTHGDLGPAHVLVGPGGDLVGVLDWEEAAIGDPATDFAWWLRERPEPAARALAAYGGAPDRRFRERADLRWALMPWHEADHGVRIGDADMMSRGLAGARTRAASLP